jgi:hypothetical protein
VSEDNNTENKIGYEEWMRKVLTHGGLTCMVLGLALIFGIDGILALLGGIFIAFVGTVGLRTGIKGPETEVVQMISLFWSPKE